jgi:hypothetical protein
VLGGAVCSDFGARGRDPPGGQQKIKPGDSEKIKPGDSLAAATFVSLMAACFAATAPDWAARLAAAACSAGHLLE